MFRVLRLLLPALMPSWRFFEAVEASPRVEWSLLDGQPPQWREFRPRPAHLSPLSLLGRLFWNPGWNESLYLVSLAERLVLSPTPHSEAEIARRIASDAPAGRLQFRLVFISRRGMALHREVGFLSAPFPAVPPTAAP